MAKFSSRTLAYAGVLVAMNVVLTRLAAIPIGPILRITVGSVPIILAGLWLGPVAGGLSGAAGDLIGCVISGFAPNPLITLSAALTGILPALFRPFIMGRSAGVRRFLRLLLVLAGTMLVTSQGTTVLGLALIYGLPMRETWVARLPQSAFLCVLNSFLTELLLSRVRVPGIAQLRSGKVGVWSRQEIR